MDSLGWWRDDDYDPFSFNLSPRRQPAVPLLDEEERDSALMSLAKSGLSGLSWIGSTLDKPGSAVRGLLAGKPEQLLNLIPFSDTFGWTDPATRVSGQELLGTKGQDDWGSWLAGLGVEIATDPLTFLNPLAKTAKGANLAKTGQLAPTLGGRIRAGEQGLARFGVPFTDIGVDIGQGTQWGGAAGDWLGKVGDKALYGKVPYTNFSPGQTASALFDKRVEGKLGEEAQRTLRASANASEKSAAEAKKRALELMRPLADDTGTVLPELSDEFRGVMEGTRTPQNDVVANVAQETRQFLAGKTAPLKALGARTDDLADEFLDFFPRQKLDLDAVTNAPSEQVAARGLSAPRSAGRKDILKDVPSGSEGLSRYSMDPEFLPGQAQLPKAERTRRINEDLLRYGDPERAELAALKADRPLRRQQLRDPDAPADVIERLTQDEARYKLLKKHSRQGSQLADFFGGLDPKRASEQVPLFGRNVVDDLSDYAVRHEKSVAKLNALHDTVARVAVPLAQLGDNGVPLDKLYKSLGMRKNESLAQVGQRGRNVQGLAVPKDIADQLTRVVDGFVRPESIGPILGAFDSLTSLFKMGVTAPWPAKHFRDWVSSVWSNWVRGNTDPRDIGPIAKVLTPYQDAATLIRSGQPLMDAHTIPGLTHLTPQEASKALLDEMVATNVIGSGRQTAATGVTTGQTAAQEARTFQFAGQKQKGLLQTVKEGFTGEKGKGWEQALPWEVAGVGGRKVSKFAPAKAAGEITTWVDNLGSGAAYIAKRRAGYGMMEAAKEAKLAQLDFSRMTDFEKSVMRRVMPFYGWTKANLPNQLEQLASRPGGATAQVLRGANSLRQDEGLVPPELQNRLAIPLGPEVDGTRRYLGNFGLPFEDVGEIVGGGITGLLGQLNPLIKGPAEYATGRQFYSGRELADLHGPTGNVLVDQGIMNSPLSRIYTSGRTAIDTRKDIPTKAVNLLTGARVKDVDVDKQRNVMGRDMMEDLLRDSGKARKFESLYVPRERLGELTPDELLQYRLLRTLEADAKEKAKKKKEAAR